MLILEKLQPFMLNIATHKILNNLDFLKILNNLNSQKHFIEVAV